MGNSIKGRKRYVFMSVDPRQYPTILQMIKEQHTWQLEEILKYLKPNDSKKLVNFHDSKGVSLLMQAVALTNPSVVSLLLKYGADVSAKDDKGQTALFYTLSEKNTNKVLILRLILLENSSIIDQLDNQRNRFLHVAIRDNQTDLVEVLLDNGADPSIVDIDDASPLHRAVDIGNSDMVEMLLKKNINVNQADVLYEWTAAHICAIHDDVQILKLLIQHGADINCKDHLGKTPLTYAKLMFAQNSIKSLEKAGAIEYK